MAGGSDSVRVVLAAADCLRRAQSHGREADVQMDGIPMHRGLGPHVRGDSDRIRGLGTIGAPVDVRPWRRRIVVFLGRSDVLAFRSPT